MAQQHVDPELWILAHGGVSGARDWPTWAKWALWKSMIRAVTPDHLKAKFRAVREELLATDAPPVPDSPLHKRYRSVVTGIHKRMRSGKAPFAVTVLLELNDAIRGVRDLVAPLIWIWDEYLPDQPQWTPWVQKAQDDMAKFLVEEIQHGLETQTT